MSIARFVADRGFRLANHRESDRLLYWYVHALLWGRYSGSTETVLNIDLQRIAEDPTLERLVDELPRHLLGQQTSLELHHVFPKAS